MQFENPEIPEGINASNENPLKEFLILSLGVFGAIALLIWLLFIAIGWWAPLIPFKWEQSWISSDNSSAPFSIVSEQQLVGHEDKEAYMNQLASKILEAMEESEISVQVHYIDDDLVNAFATLGGQIYIYRGLYDRLDSENALVMLLAHEIAHVVHRDPVVALTRAVGVGSVMTIIGGYTDVSTALNSAGHLTALGFSRKQESKADKAALFALQRFYGHAGGATDLFEELLQQGDSMFSRICSVSPANSGAY